MLAWDDGPGCPGRGQHLLDRHQPARRESPHPSHLGWLGRPRSCYFEGGPTTRWGRNLATIPRVSFGVESNGMHISGRGSVTRGRAGDEFDRLLANYGGKYDYKPENRR